MQRRDDAAPEIETFWSGPPSQLLTHSFACKVTDFSVNKCLTSPQSSRLLCAEVGRDVCFWHLADILSGSLNVRFQGQSGHRVTL
jgi:hypothetical protein